MIKRTQQEYLHSEENLNRIIALGKRNRKGINNSFYGKQHTKATKEKIGATNKAKMKKMWQNPEFRERMLKMGKTRMNKLNSDPNFQKKRLEGIRKPETRQKMSKAHLGNKYNLGRKHTQNQKEKIGLKSKELWKTKRDMMMQSRTEDWKRKISESHKGKKGFWKGRKFSEGHKRNLSESRKKLYAEGKLIPFMLGKHCSEEHKRNLSENKKGHKLSFQTKTKMSLSRKILWRNPEYRERQIRNILKAQHRKPNKPETFIDSVLQTHYPNEWKLNVKGDTIINGRIPDWTNCNGQKKCINHNGTYWHLGSLLRELHKKGLYLDKTEITKEFVEELERKPYEELGFKVLFIWEDELKDQNKILDKIKDFSEVI